MRAELEQALKAAGEAAAAAVKEREGLEARAAKADEEARRAAAAAADAHAAGTQGLRDMLTQSEADYATLKSSKEAAEAALAEALREVEAVKEAAGESEFQMERERNRLQEAVELKSGC